MAKIDEPTLSISKVSKQTELPVSTIRYYEKEFESYLRIQKTSGGHRRYKSQDVEKLKYIRDLVQEQGKSLHEIREMLVSDEDPTVLRSDLNLLLDVFHTLVVENRKLRGGIETLAKRISTMEDEKAKKKRFGIFG